MKNKYKRRRSVTKDSDGNKKVVTNRRDGSVKIKVKTSDDRGTSKRVQVIQPDRSVSRTMYKDSNGNKTKIRNTNPAPPSGKYVRRAIPKEDKLEIDTGSPVITMKKAKVDNTPVGGKKTRRIQMTQSSKPKYKKRVQKEKRELKKYQTMEFRDANKNGIEDRKEGIYKDRDYVSTNFDKNINKGSKKAAKMPTVKTKGVKPVNLPTPNFNKSRPIKPTDSELKRLNELIAKNKNSPLAGREEGELARLATKNRKWTSQ